MLKTLKKIVEVGRKTVYVVFKYFPEISYRKGSELASE